MKQLEIQFFWPLTEQLELDLDYEPCRLYAEELKRQKEITFSGITSGQYLVNVGTGTTSWTQPITTSFVVKPSVKNVGKWEISDSMFVYRPTKPNAVIRFMAKHLLGFKWHDEN